MTAAADPLPDPQASVPEPVPPPAAAPGSLAVSDQAGVPVLAAAGRWDLKATAILTEAIATAETAVLAGSGAGGPVRLDLSGVESLDTVGALLLSQLRGRLAAAGRTVEVTGCRTAHQGLLSLVWRSAGAPPAPPPPDGGIGGSIALVGRTVSRGLDSAFDLAAFFGRAAMAFLRVLIRPGRIRVTSVVHHLEHVGLRCLPILGLLAFLIGIVLGYQSTVQLERVGAESILTELVGLSILREMGSLITAIIVAGRSGSAFTAQIGTMKVTQEVDAMRTMGLDPMELLVVPRILALVVAVPLLTFFANIVALLGAATMTWAVFDMNYVEFFNDLRVPLDIYDAGLGLAKSPVFAFVIAMVGCYEGLRVAGSAESVGLHTTKAVVKSIFLVIVLNAFFSVLATALRI